MSRALGALAVAGMLSVACSGGKGSTSHSPAGAGKPATGAGVELRVPEGWTSEEVAGRGLVVASRQEDVDADVPSGPRLVAILASGEVPDPVTALGTARGEQPVLRGDPESVTVDGRKAIAVEMSLIRGGASLVSRGVVVVLEPGTAYTFTLEAPQDQWDSNEAVLQGILDSVHFVEPSAS